MKNKIIEGVALAILLVGGYMIFQRTGDSSYKTESPATTVAPPITPLTAPVTMAVVAEHNSATSCWTVIDGNVYDLTGWIPQHPGGERAIISLCGKDGTAAFHGQHDDAKRQADILATFKIGTVSGQK